MGDSLWCTWAADNNEYCALNDGFGIYNSTTTFRNTAGYDTSIYKRAAGSQGLNITNLGNLNTRNETGPWDAGGYPQTYLTDNQGRPYFEGIISPGDRYGNIYFDQSRYTGSWSFTAPHLCNTFHRTSDYFQTIVGAHNNKGRHRSGNSSTVECRVDGLSDDAGMLGGGRRALLVVAAGTGLRWALDRHGWTQPATHVAGTDAWAYAFSYSAASQARGSSS